MIVRTGVAVAVGNRKGKKSGQHPQLGYASLMTLVDWAHHYHKQFYSVVLRRRSSCGLENAFDQTIT